MILTVTPKRFDLIVNTEKKTAAQIRKETGADIVINCWLYDMSKFKAVADVKDNGKVLSDDKYTYWGYGFDRGDNRMTMSNDMAKWENYFAVVGMVKAGKKLPMYYDKAMGGSRPRSAVGFKPNGEMVIYCATTGATIEKVQTTMLTKGCVDAICLDGGGSVQIASDYGNIGSARRVHGLLAIWIDKGKSPCPFTKPTLTVKRGSRGNGAKWVQWMLNRHGLYVEVDGVFGTDSENKLMLFQLNAGLKADGECGKLTRAALKAGGS